MRFIRLLFPTLGLLTLPIEAAEPEFAVTPSECIAAEKGQPCELEIHFTYPRLDNKDYCLFVNEQRQGCWRPNKLPTTMSLSVSQTSKLTLSDKQGEFSVSTMLNIKYRSSRALRRRVRNPWSVF